MLDCLQFVNPGHVTDSINAKDSEVQLFIHSTFTSVLTLLLSFVLFLLCIQSKLSNIEPSLFKEVRASEKLHDNTNKDNLCARALHDS